MLVVHEVLGVLITTVLFTFFSFLTVVLRLVARLFIVCNVFVEDYLIVAASIASFGYLGGVLAQIEYGLGQPYESIPSPTAEKFLQSIYASFPLYNLSLLLCKLSLVLQYRRIFPTPLMWQVCSGLLLLLVLYGAWTLLGAFFMCLPVPVFWGVGDGACMSKAGVWYSNAAVNMVTDGVVFAVPIAPLSQLQIPRAQKGLLMVLFVCGAFVCIASALRLHSLHLFVSSADPTAAAVGWAIWSAVETNVAIACACIPALQPLCSQRIQTRLLADARAGAARGPRKSLTVASDFNDGYYPPVPHPTYPLPARVSPGTDWLWLGGPGGGGTLNTPPASASTRAAFQLAMHVATHPEPTPTPTEDGWETARIGVAVTMPSSRPLVPRTNAIVVTPRDTAGVPIYQDADVRAAQAMGRIEEALGVWEGQRGEGRRIC